LQLDLKIFLLNLSGLAILPIIKANSGFGIMNFYPNPDAANHTGSNISFVRYNKDGKRKKERENNNK
jgi:hypothetical protein